MRKIYLDNSATTKVKKEVLETMLPYFQEEYGNPSSVYELGRNAKSALEQARDKISDILNCEPNEMYFTSCGTESNNWVFQRVCDLYPIEEKNEIIISPIEHPSVREVCKYLEKKGYKIIEFNLDKRGKLNIRELNDLINEKTLLVSLIMCNNEVGVLLPVKEVSKLCVKRGVLLHTDGTQAVGKMPVNIRDLGVSFFSYSGHKIGAPKGVGGLYVSRNVDLPPLLFGGGQESEKRSGTENVAYCVGMAKAMELAYRNLDNKIAHWKVYSEHIVRELSKLEGVIINGSSALDENNAPHIISLSIKNLNSENLLLLLDTKNIYVSAGSACSSKAVTPSRTLEALGISEDYIYGTLRISFNDETTMEDIESFIYWLKYYLEFFK